MGETRKVVIDFDNASEEDWQTVYDSEEDWQTVYASEEEWQTVYDSLSEIEHEPDETSKAGVFIGKRVPAEGVE